MTATPSTRLVLICGLPGAGKTTLARELETALPAVRLGADGWMVDLGVDLFDEPFRAQLEARMRELAARLLGLGVSVVLEFGFWARVERDALLAIGRDLGVAVELRYLDVPVDELWHRVDARNRSGAWPGRPITRADLDEWSGIFEPPTADEVASYDAPVQEPTRGAPEPRPTHEVLRTTTAAAEEIRVVVAHSERATVRVGDVFLKIDADQTRAEVEVAAMAIAPIPTPEVLWRKAPVLALAALPGTALGHLGESSTAPAAAWAAAGAAVRALHDAPLPPWPGRSRDDLAARLASECEWLVAHDVLPADVVTRNRRLAETALGPWTPVFIHGDLQVDHVFVSGDRVTGVLDWSEASRGDALFDLATLTLGHEEHLGDVVAGYGTEVDRDLIRAWWSLRCLSNVRWLVEHGFGPPDEMPEVAVLRAGS